MPKSKGQNETYSEIHSTRHPLVVTCTEVFIAWHSFPVFTASYSHGLLDERMLEKLFSRRETKHQHKLETLGSEVQLELRRVPLLGLAKISWRRLEISYLKPHIALMLETFSPSSPTKSIFEICQCWLKKKTFRLLNLAAVRDTWTSCSAWRKFSIVPKHNVTYVGVADEKRDEEVFRYYATKSLHVITRTKRFSR